MRPFALAIALAVSAAIGCASPISRGRAQFVEGRYPDAKETWASLEIESRGWDDARRAEYALYRGLTYAALGDRDQAGIWLREARAIENAHPGSLSRDDVSRLTVASENSLDGP